MADSDKPNNELLDLKQLKSIKVALWTLVTVFVILPVIAGIGTGVVIGFMALTADDPGTGGGIESIKQQSTPSQPWSSDDVTRENPPAITNGFFAPKSNPENVETPSKSVEIADPIVEMEIRRQIRKYTGELTEADLEKVTELSFSHNTRITDECLKEMAKLPKLRGLGLWDTQVTDAGMKEVAKLTQLERINLGGTKITDRGLREVSKLTKLTYLNLRYISRITNAGLKELVKCKQLRELYLGHTQITDTAELQKALPKCEIGD